MKLFGVTGAPGSGRTELVARLVPQIAARGLRVSTIHHMPPGFDVDRPGRDSHRHRQAGASQVLLASRNRMALMSELRGGPPAELQDLLQRMQPCDLVLVCGEALAGLPRIALCDEEEAAIAMPADITQGPPRVAQPVFAPDDTAAITEFILREVGL